SRRNIARVLDSVLIIGGSKGGRTGAKLVLLAIDGQLDCAFFDEPEFAMRMAVRRMRSAAGIESGFVNLYALPSRRSAVHDAARLRCVVHFMRMQVFEG